MSTNKHATIRYHVLDYCFSNFRKNYYMEDLIDACNEALYEFAGITDGVKRRQIYDDIKFMESEQGWLIQLKRYKDGRKTYYRYADKSYSIKNQPINVTELEQLSETLAILTRFRGMPHFEWMEDILLRIESTFNLESSCEAAISLEHNPYLKGLNYFSDIFSAIQNKILLKIQYKGFKQTKIAELIFHPYFLKQYNNRWFVFGFNENQNSISNLALDRIESIEQSSGDFIENTKINFEEYFDDVLGVTVKEKEKPSIITLQVEESLFPYIESKPIHGSQKIKNRMDDKVVIELEMQINYELISLLFSFGENIKVISPKKLQNMIKNKAESVVKKYL